MSESGLWANVSGLWPLVLSHFFVPCFFLKTSEEDAQFVTQRILSFQLSVDFDGTEVSWSFFILEANCKQNLLPSALPSHVQLTVSEEKAKRDV